MSGTTVTVPAELLHDVQAVLAGALAHLDIKGWARLANSDGVRLVDALNYASAHGGASRDAHLLVFACVAMAVEPHASVPAHELLPSQLADRYLDSNTPDDELHRLDASIVVRYNTERCGGFEDASHLLHIAYERAEQTIAAQLTYRPAGPR